MNSNTISILGCGWLGLPLGEHLYKKGYVVKGSTLFEEDLDALKQKGILPFQLELTDTTLVADRLREFLNSDMLIISFPPERRKDIETYHPAQFNLLVSALKNSTVKKVLFVSSTSVYPDLNREVFENETAPPVKASGKALKLVEELLMLQTNFITTVIRFSGLIGYERVPGLFLAEKTTVENGDVPINVIHRDDCIGLISQIIQQNKWGEVFNASSDFHPTRKEFYSLAADKAGLRLPDFNVGKERNFKIINSTKIKKQLGYEFKYPNPLAVLTDCPLT